MAQSDEDFLALTDEVEIGISALEHYSYCPRQCALIHVEQTYEENIYTIKGMQVHESVDSGFSSSIRGMRAVRAIPLWSEKYGLRGKADLVEFRGKQPCPVEYKLGSKRSEINHAAIQLCAQALCLEEMLGVPVPKGAIYYATTRQREEIEIDETLRQQTIEVIEKTRAMLASQVLPLAFNDKRCRNCSLLNSCLPAVTSNPNRLRGLQSTLFQPYGSLEENINE
jgi:CRISPR-associated exonuclease Cas4